MSEATCEQHAEVNCSSPAAVHARKPAKWRWKGRAEERGRTGTTEPGAAATFMSFEYMKRRLRLGNESLQRNVCEGIAQ